MYYVQVLIFLLPLVSALPRECDKLGIHFYQALGCNITQTDSSLCPISYECPQYEVGDDFCMAGGKHYEFGDTIKESPNCHGCFCSADFGDGSQFMCYISDCAAMELAEGCYYASDVGGCCPGPEYCPDETTYKCEVDGQTYLQHQMIFPKDTCWECACKPGFTLFEEPYCRKIQCGIELDYFEQLEDDLTPFYYKIRDTDALCCPSGFISPDTISAITLEHVEPNPTGINCSFGIMQLPLRSRISVNFQNYNLNITASCTCDVAPHPTCVVKLYN